MRTLLLLPALAAAASSIPLKDVGPQLRAAGVPEIPAAVKERMRQYENTRHASVEDWVEGGKGLLITTRFGETAQAHRVDAPMGARQQLTFEEEPVRGALWGSWQGKAGFFYSKDSGGDEQYQIWHFDQASGEHRLLTDGKSRNVGKRLSTRRDKLAYSSTRRNGKDFDVYVQDLADGPARLLLQVEGNWEVADWSPDDRELLVHHYVSANESYHWRVDARTGERRPLFPPMDRKVAHGPARYAPDGKGVFLVTDRFSEFRQLAFADLATQQTEVLSQDIPWDVEELEVSRDGRRLAFTVNEDGVSRLHVLRLPERFRERLPELPMGLVSDLRFDDSGDTLAFTLNSPKGPGDAWTLDIPRRALTRWTRSEVGGLDASRFVEPELVRYPTFDRAGGGPRLIPAFYYRPRGKGPFPVVVHIHGGPESQYQPGFSSTIQYWLNELGIAVLAPNVRGSSGYGKSYLLLDNADKREDSVKDVGAALDWIKGRPELDASRVGVYGGSYGGYMVLATMARFPGRVRAGVDVVGISNFVTFLTNTKDYRRDLRRVEYGDERDPRMRAFLESISPTSIAPLIRAPLFVVQGANDPRVPASEAEQIVEVVRGRLLKESGGGTSSPYGSVGRGAPVWYLLAMDEGHGFAKKKNRDYFGNAVSVFWETHLLR